MRIASEPLVTAIAAELSQAQATHHLDLCWSPRVDTPLRELLKKGEGAVAARALEAIATTERDLTTRASWIQCYIHASYLHLSALCYVAAGQLDYAAAMSRANLIRYSHDLPLTEPATAVRRALETELKADIQMVFDPAAANELYDMALLDYAGLGPSEEWGETCDCYWDVVDDRRIQVFLACAGPDVVVESSKSAHERIPKKRKIIESIMLRGQRASR